MLKKLFLIAVCVPALIGVAHATTNYVNNPSFETGLSGWTVTGGGSNPVGVIVTDGSTGSAYGEVIPSDPLTSGDPGLVGGGNYAVYFVDDTAHQTLTQLVHLTVGTYAIGFDAYVPVNGFGNTNDAAFTGSIANVQLANFDVQATTAHSVNDPNAWQEYSGIVNVASNGNYLVSFDFLPGGYPAGDVVVDRVFVVPSDGTGTTTIGVPEPLTISLFGAGLIGAAAYRRRRSAKKS